MMETPGKEISILIVEDDTTSRSTMVEMISRKYPALKISSADNGAVGLSLYREKEFDIVVTDINMPVMDGIEMVRAIRSIKPAALVIVLTAFKDSSYLLDAINVGVSSYVLKPIDHLLLFSAIDECVTRIRQKLQIDALNHILTTHAQQLEMLNKELTTANDELQAFNFMVSHDLRQPLHKISLYCQVLLDQSGQEMAEESRNFIEGIDGSVRQMDALIDALLDFSRISNQEIRKEKVDLAKIAREIAADLSLQQPTRQVSFLIEAAAEAEGDAQLLKVVLNNLMTNAWKFTSKNESTLIEFKQSRHEGKPVYCVRDNGVGFDLENPEELFNPFHRHHNKADYDGHGIGLFTVQKIVERHGGRVWAEGAPKKGAAFFFAL